MPSSGRAVSGSFEEMAMLEKTETLTKQTGTFYTVGATAGAVTPAACVLRYAGKIKIKDVLVKLTSCQLPK